jgi:hypothetical protein
MSLATGRYSNLWHTYGIYLAVQHYRFIVEAFHQAAGRYCCNIHAMQRMYLSSETKLQKRIQCTQKNK